MPIPSDVPNAARRYARVSTCGHDIAAYLPANYSVIATNGTGLDQVVTIGGHDSAGWTLDGYVIPRLASGLYFAREVAPCDARLDYAAEKVTTYAA